MTQHGGLVPHPLSVDGQFRQVVLQAMLESSELLGPAPQPAALGDGRIGHEFHQLDEGGVQLDDVLLAAHLRGGRGAGRDRRCEELLRRAVKSC